MFSTVDICAVDLFIQGSANFAMERQLRLSGGSLGGGTSSESLAAGLVQRIDFDTASRKLYHGTCLVMMTEGCWMHFHRSARKKP